MRIKPVVLVAFALGFGVTILTLQTTASHASLRGQAPGASPTGTLVEVQVMSTSTPCSSLL